MPRSCARSVGSPRPKQPHATALALEPERVGAHNNLGNILRDAGRYQRKR